MFDTSCFLMRATLSSVLLWNRLYVFLLPVMCFNQTVQRHRFFAQLFGQLFRNFPENCGSRSPKVMSSGQVK